MYVHWSAKKSHKINIVFILSLLAVIKQHQWFLNCSFLWQIWDWINSHFHFLLVYQVFHALRTTQVCSYNRLFSLIIKEAGIACLKVLLLPEKVGKSYNFPSFVLDWTHSTPLQSPPRQWPVVALLPPLATSLPYRFLLYLSVVFFQAESSPLTSRAQLCHLFGSRALIKGVHRHSNLQSL